MKRFRTKTWSTLTFTSLALAAGLLSGCAIDSGPGGDDADDELFEEGVATAEQAIVGGRQVTNNSLYARSTVSLTGCSGIIISSRHVLTAAHCRQAVGSPVRFYQGALPSGPTRRVTNVAIKPGVNAAAGDYTDTAGKFADIAVLTLDADIPATSRAAELPYLYPGNRKWGVMVGKGRHDDSPNPEGELHYKWTKTYSSDTNDGHFLVDSADIDDIGDTGGPLYMWNWRTGNVEVQGVLFGSVSEWALHGKYTSVRHHLDWVMHRIGYNGGVSWAVERVAVGDFTDSRVVRVPAHARHRFCALSCEKDRACNGVSLHEDSTCYLLTGVTGTRTDHRSDVGTYR